MEHSAAKKKKKKRAAKAVEVAKNEQQQQHFCDDDNFDENLRVIKIEFCDKCGHFREQANKLFSNLREALPNIEIKLLANESEKSNVRLEPRREAFEVWFARNGRDKFHLIWTGIDKGPPRRAKFEIDIPDLVYKIKQLNKLK